MVKPGRIVADPARERHRHARRRSSPSSARPPRSSLAAVAVSQDSKTLLVIALLVHWVGDSLDGQVARWFDCETRTGAVLDIMSDRLCAAAFYIGLAWLEPNLAPAIFVYLAEFMVIDSFLSIAFLAWPITSPNYFYVVDRKLWLLNWSHPGKAVNSGLFAILLLVTGWMWVGLAIAVVLLVHKSISLVKLMRLGPAALRRAAALPRGRGAAVRDGPRAPGRSSLPRPSRVDRRRFAGEAGPDDAGRLLRRPPCSRSSTSRPTSPLSARRWTVPPCGASPRPRRPRADGGQGAAVLRRRVDDEPAVAEEEDGLSRSGRRRTSAGRNASTPTPARPPRSSSPRRPSASPRST